MAGVNSVTIWSIRGGALWREWVPVGGIGRRPFNIYNPLCRLINPPTINVNGFGLGQVLLQNRFELVGGGYEPCRLKTPPTINVNDFGQSRP